MPVPLNSRYRGLPVYQAADAAGNAHPTVAMRLPAAPDLNAVSYNHLLTGTETTEYLAWRYYGSSPAWWRIADANPFTFPLDLITGTAIAIPSPASVGRVERTRRF